MTLYFAFGSNLDLKQMARRCPGATVGPFATLQDHRLLFRGPSSRRKAGVATVDAHPGESVPGLLFEVGEACLAVLDRLEGHPAWYQRTWLEVETADGERVEALLYRLPERVVAMAPTEAYVGQIGRAYAHHGPERGFDPALLEPAVAVSR